MNDFSIPGTQSSPGIQGDWARGVLSMQGDSYPENAYDLFHTVVEWVGAFLKGDQRALTLELELLYLNTSSIKALMDIFDMLEDAHSCGRAVSVNWRYDIGNERVAELAAEFKEDCTFPFAIIGKP